MFEKILITFKDLIFPNRCVCGKWDTVLCDNCRALIPTNKKDLCPHCKSLSEHGKFCSRCRGRTSLTGVMVFGKHKGILKDLIWNYKYEGIRDLNEPLTEFVIKKYGDFSINKNFLVTFVPISKERMMWRGYNQAELIAKGFATNLNLEFLSLLHKHSSIPQVGLSRAERIRNIKDKISLQDGDLSLKNKKILIFDDVYTTGSTLEECSKVLRAAGAAEVWGIVLSRE